MLTPRGYQQSGHDSIFRLIDAGKKRICATAPTGAGKSVSLTMDIHEGIRRGWRVSLYTHRSVLIPQLSAMLTQQGIDHGIRASGHDPDLDKRVQISMWQTEAARCMSKKPRWNLHAADLVLVDEAHGYTASTTQKIIEKHTQDGAAVVGYTATPVDLWHLFSELVVITKNSELQQVGAHLPCLEFAPDEPDSKGIRRASNGEFVEGDVEKRMTVPVVFGRVLQHYKKLNPFQMPGILFGPSVDGSKYFCDEFLGARIPAAHIDAKQIYYGHDPKSGAPIIAPSSQKNRSELFDKVRQGDIKMLCNRFVLTEGLDCLDSETEILTVSGWRKNGEVQEGDYIYNYNADSGLMEVDRVSRVVSRKVRPGEKMVIWKSQHYDIRVTEGHDMLIRHPVSRKRNPKGHTEWVKKPAIDCSRMKSIYSLPLSADLDGRFNPVGLPLTDDEIRFCAWVITDGSFEGGGNKTIATICQSHKKYANHIRDLLDRLGYDYKEYVREYSSDFGSGREPVTGKASIFSVPAGLREGKSGYGHLRQYIQKEGSDLWMRMTREQFQVFWHELILGDGQLRIRNHGKGKGASRRSPILTVNNKKLADSLSMLAVTRGFSCSIGTYLTKNEHRMYYLTVRDKHAMSITPSDSRSTKPVTRDAVPGESVWCVSTNNGTVVTRRNGKIVITGNCPELHYCALATMFGSVKTYLQAAGRLLRAHPSMDHTVLCDHGGSIWRHGSVNEDREWEVGKTSKEVYEERVKRMEQGEAELAGITCPKCSYVRLSGPTCHNCGHTHVRSSRTVIQQDGTLKRMDGCPIKKKRVQLDAVKAWNGMYWPSYKSKNPHSMTFQQLWNRFKHKHPEMHPHISQDMHGRKRLAVVDPSTSQIVNLPLHPPLGDKYLWSQKVRDIPTNQLLK